MIITEGEWGDVDGPIVPFPHGGFGPWPIFTRIEIKNPSPELRRMIEEEKENG